MNEKKNNQTFENPFSEKFLLFWDKWKEFQASEFRVNFYSTLSENGAIAYLVDISEGDEETAIKIIKQSIGKHWKNFYPIKTIKINKNQSNGTKQTAHSTATRESLNDLYNQRFGQGR